MKYLALSFFCLLAGFIAGTLQLLSSEPRPPASYAKPAAVFTHAGRRCVAWTGQYRGADLYSVHCDDGTVIFTRNYFYF